MSNPIGFEFGKQLTRAIGIEALDPRSAMGRHNAQFVWVHFQQARDKTATARFEVTQHMYFILKTF